MSGLQGHLVRRGVEIATHPANEQYIQWLDSQARLYAESGKENAQPWEILLPVVSAVVFMVLIASVKYTIGEVGASLAMIEQPTTTVIVSERRTPFKDDEADATLEKTPLVDEEVVVLKEKPVTSSIRKTIQHLHQVGGFRARWRGLSASVMYHFLHGLTAHTFGRLVFSGRPFLQPVAYIIASVLLCRIHATWTMIMVSKPSDKVWYRRVPAGRQIFKTLVLPSAVFALAQQSVIVFPAIMFLALGALPEEEVPHVAQRQEVLRILMTLATAGLTAIFVLLPASVTLTRIEASLLPEDEDTIVSFDRTLNGATTSAIALGSAASAKSIFIAAWKSFDKPAQLRLVKYYMKMVFIQIYLTVTAAVVVAGQVFLIGPEKLNAAFWTGIAEAEHARFGQ